MAGAQELTMVCIAGMVTVAVPGVVIANFGFSISVTVTLKVFVDMPNALIAVTVTVVVPIGNKLPDATE